MGKRIRGNSAVAASGKASVIHHTAIQRPIAAVHQPCCDSPPGAGLASTIAATTGPDSKPIKR